MRWIGVAALGVMLGLPVAAQAGLPVIAKETCAIGGERFTYTTSASYTIFGHHPDGRPYGSWTFPAELPICPQNGLVMYRDFTPDELTRLPALLASPEFLALRKTETSYYRAAWLERALGGSPANIAWLTLNAVWQSDDDLPRQHRYDQAFLDAVGHVPQEPDSLSWLALQVRAVNALREMGRFDEAAAALKAVPQAALAPRPIPPSDPDGDAKDKEKSRANWRAFLEKLAAPIARRDASKEALDLLPVTIAAHLCTNRGQTPPRADPLCASAPIAEEIARFKAERDRTETDPG